MTCEKCGQGTVPESIYADGWSVPMLPTGHFVCSDCHRRAYGGGERHEAVQLFAPAPNVMPGQLGFGVSGS